MLFKSEFHPAIVEGRCVRTYRYWKRPQVKIGGVYRIHPIGLIRVDDFAKAKLADIDASAARHAGFASKKALAAVLSRHRPAGSALYRVDFTYLGADDRERLDLKAELDADERAALTAALERKDRARPRPWTLATLDLIRAHPGKRAAELAGMLGRELPKFKADVRQLKALGLTQSLEVGYRLSPRGEAYLARA